MSSRSLKVSVQQIPRVKSALKRNSFKSQQAFATELGVSRDTVRKFLNGYNIDRNYFIDFCDILGLNWQEITDKSKEIDNPADFVGREKALIDLATLTQNHKLILIHGAGGIGKTELAKQYLKTQGFEFIIELLMAKETQNISSIDGVVEEWIKQYFNKETNQDFSINLDRLKRLLKEHYIGILIDNLEPALEKGKFIKEHRNYLELLRVLANPDLQSLTLVTSREKLVESAINLGYYSLDGLTEDAWKNYFISHQIDIECNSLKAMRDAYGGNAKAMRILLGAIKEDYDNNLSKYWQENQKDLLIKLELKDLVTTEFEGLKKEDIDAYNLLCRLGCYRYQEISKVPIEGLFCLLWDVDKIQQGRVIERLKNRALLEHESGKYWLHSVIKQEARERLENTENWEKANYEAGKFWTKSVETVETLEDALYALEACYHYLNIEDYEQAGKVIAQERNNKWEKNEPLGASFYRLGVFKPIIKLIDKIIENYNKNTICLATLYNLKGHFFWSVGKPREAILLHEKSSKIGKNIFEARANFNIGLCLLDLGEIEQAEYKFNQVCEIASNNEEDNYLLVESYFCLAFIKSYFDDAENAKKFLKKFDGNQEKLSQIYWTQGYSYIFIALTYKNLGQIKSARDYYQEALDFAKESNYPQVEAKALIGLGEIYRIEEDYDKAIQVQQRSIDILSKIDAKCDLAEAYYQIALTYQDMEKIKQEYKDRSRYNFDQSIDLFKTIKAPKQIQKITNLRKNQSCLKSSVDKKQIKNLFHTPI